MAPSSVASAARKVSSGSTRISASTRGSTSTLFGSSPMTRSASISSRMRIEPSSAVMALPERPATMMAVRSGATSRSDRMPTRSTVKMAAPK